MIRIKDKRGTTLAELLISLSLIMVVMLPVGLVLINNTKFFNEITENSDIQRKAQIAMKEVQDILYVSKGITEVETGQVADGGFSEIKSMKVLLPSGVRRIIQVSGEGNLLIDSEFITDGILLEARPTKGTFANTDGVDLRITCSKEEVENRGNENLRIVNRIYFRNMGY